MIGGNEEGRRLSDPLRRGSMSIGANLHHPAVGGGSANSPGNNAIEYRYRSPVRARFMMATGSSFCARP